MSASFPYPTEATLKSLTNLSEDDALRLCRFIIMTAMDERGLYLNWAKQAELSRQLHELAKQLLFEGAA